MYAEGDGRPPFAENAAFETISDRSSDGGRSWVVRRVRLYRVHHREAATRSEELFDPGRGGSCGYWTSPRVLIASK